MINWLKREWYGLNSFNELELLILNTVRQNLHPEAVILWDSQLNEVNKVQRSPHGVESNFYSLNLETGKPSFNKKIVFPNHTEELKIALVTLSTQNNKIDVEVYSINGYLFSLEFKGSSLYWIEYLGNMPDDEIIVKCKILANIMKTVV